MNKTEARQQKRVTTGINDIMEQVSPMKTCLAEIDRI